MHGFRLLDMTACLCTYGDYLSLSLFLSLVSQPIRELRSPLFKGPMSACTHGGSAELGLPRLLVALCIWRVLARRMGPAGGQSDDDCMGGDMDETACLPIDDPWVAVSYSACRASSSLRRQAPIAGSATVRRWKMRGAS